MLDRESFPDDARLKSVINSSFQRLPTQEKKALISLSVFPGCFGLAEAEAVLNIKSEFKTGQIIRSLERKSLIDCGDNFVPFSIHSLLPSFIEEERKTDHTVQAVFLDAQHQFYDYYISICKVANEHFLKGHYSASFRRFLDRRECILLSLSNGP